MTPNESLEYEILLIARHLQAMRNRFDTRLVAASLLYRAAKLHQALIAAGLETPEAAKGLFDMHLNIALETSGSPPEVVYLTGGTPAPKR